MINPYLREIQLARRCSLIKDGHRDLVDRIDELKPNADLDLLALEGLEVNNRLEIPVRARLFFSKSSGRFYLDLLNAGADGTRIEGEEYNSVPVEIKEVA